MLTTAPHLIVLGICPERFLADQQFNLVQAAAELHEGRWARLGGTSTKYVPEGRFYVYRDHCRDLQAHEIAAWEVEDQHDWAERKLLTRYRAVRRAEAPFEILTAKITSNAIDSREYLTTVGVDALVGRTDGLALIEFADGVIAKMRLVPHETVPGRSVAMPTELHQPLEAWPTAKEFHVLTFTPNGRIRRFVTSVEVGHAPETVDLATWDEILVAATRSGGIGAYSGPSLADLRKSRDKLQEVLKTFPPGRWDSRRKRIEQFLADADCATEAREDLAKFHASHPTFRKAVEVRAGEKAEELRKLLRTEVFAEEMEVALRIKAKEGEFGEVEQLVRQVEEQRTVIAREVEQFQEQKSALETEVEALGRQKEAPPERVASTPQPKSSSVWLSGNGEASLTKAEDVVGLIEKNLSALGVNNLTARNIGFEAVVAASLGQVTFFRGSLARPIAEAVGMSFAGKSLSVVRMTVGMSDTISLDVKGPQAILLVGANLACLDAYGDEIKREVFQRRLAANYSRTPVLLGTLEDGPSALPVHDGFLDLGPILDTDLLPWELPAKEPAIVFGRLEPTALKVADGEAELEAWKQVFKTTALAPGGIWPGTAIAVLKRLAGLASVLKGVQPATSFLYGWFLPKLLLSQSPLSEQGEAIQCALTVDEDVRDPRVQAFLAANWIAHSTDGGQ